MENIYKIEISYINDSSEEVLIYFKNRKVGLSINIAYSPQLIEFKKSIEESEFIINLCKLIDNLSYNVLFNEYHKISYCNGDKERDCRHSFYEFHKVIIYFDCCIHESDIHVNSKLFHCGVKSRFYRQYYDEVIMKLTPLIERINIVNFDDIVFSKNN